MEPQKQLRPNSGVVSTAKPQVFARNPIITVTEHTPTPSPDYMKRQGSIDSQLDALSHVGSFSKINMLRSHTHSHIAYTGADDNIEAPGSSFYITSEGAIDYEILLLVREIIKPF